MAKTENKQTNKQQALTYNHGRHQQMEIGHCAQINWAPKCFVKHFGNVFLELHILQNLDL